MGFVTAATESEVIHSSELMFFRVLLFVVIQFFGKNLKNEFFWLIFLCIFRKTQNRCLLKPNKLSHRINNAMNFTLHLHFSSTPAAKARPKQSQTESFHAIFDPTACRMGGHIPL